MGGINGTGTVGNIPRDSQPNISGIVKQINDNPEGFTLNLNGEKISNGFVVSPYKGREVILDKVDASNVRNFISKNINFWNKREIILVDGKILKRR